MRLLAQLQDRIGFTRNEILVILFLSATFLCGLALRWYNQSFSQEAPAQFDYAKLDSIFAARSHTPESVRTAGRGLAGQASSKKLTSPGTHIDINTAGKEELMRLPGIGGAMAERVIEYRIEHGLFETVEDLANVRGIGKKKLELLRPFVVVREDRDRGVPVP